VFSAFQEQARLRHDASTGEYSKGDTGASRSERYSWLFLVAWALFILSIFPSNAAAMLATIFRAGDVQIERMILHVGAAIALVYYALTAKERTPVEHVVVLVCLVVSRVCLLSSGVPTFFWATLLVACAKGVDFDRIVWVYLGMVVALMLAYWLMSVLGIVPSFDYEAARGFRHAFGSVYPTDFAAHVFFVALALAYLRRDALNAFDVALDLGLAWFCHTQCIARSATICLVLLALVCGYVFAKRRITNKPFELATPGLALAIGVSLASCLFMLLASWCFDPASDVFLKLDALLSTRLSLGRTAFDTLSITSFGQRFEMVGLGGYTDVAAAGGMFYLDCSYMQVLMRWGVSSLFICMAAMVFAQVRAYRAGVAIVPLLVMLVCIHCITDQYLVNYCYNFFMLAVTARLTGGPKCRISVLER
jgi:hypothetical protein